MDTASRHHLLRRHQTSTVEVFLTKEYEVLWGNELSKVGNRELIVDERLDFTFTSRKNTNVMTHANAEKVAETAQGRKYGYFFKNSEFPKVFGKRSAGCDNEPPIVGLQESVGIPDQKWWHPTYPRAPPKDQESGMYA